ncbi:hypothetical protein [Butyrivibrio fibrisolvens]|uniref:hypothetical protein n=1 Tax=Butyrivibrio fibrisolvens TaxID=831 RepID=UPI0003B3A945|nr:hypothetical protein [Butyrivibrio fibrisolvens]
MKRLLSKISLIIIIPSVSLFMSACATDDTIPISKEENKEEYDQVTTYAAELLMKYSYNVVDDLTYVAIKNSDKGPYYDEKKTSDTTNAFADMAIEAGEGQTTEVVDAGNTEADDPDNIDQTGSDIDVTESGDDNIVAGIEDDNTDTDSSTDVSIDESGGQGNDEGSDKGTDQDDSRSDLQNTVETVAADDDLSDLDSELGGLKLSFNGYSVMNAYPSSSAQGGVVAGDGEKILVLNFGLSNPTSSAISLNILNRNATFKVSVNGQNVGYTKVTMLINDLSSYVGTVSSGSEEQLVLLVVIPSSQASSISDITVTAAINGKTYTIKLE